MPGSTPRCRFSYHSACSPMPTRRLTQLYRSDWGRIVATLIRLFGDFDMAEEAAQEAFAAALDQWRDSGVPEFPRAWIIQTARHKAIDRIRRRHAVRGKTENLRRGRIVPDRGRAGLRHGRNPRRSPAADLHLLPPCPRARGAGRLDAANAGRPRNRRDRARVSRAHGNDGAAARARQAQDPRRRHSVCRARDARHARAARRRADGDLPHFQRRLCGHPRRSAGEDRSLRRGDPSGTAGDGAAGAAAARRKRPAWSPSCCFTIRGALPVSTGPAIWCFSKSRIAAAGIDDQIAEALPLVEEAFRGGPGPIALQAAIAAVHCQAARRRRYGLAADPEALRSSRALQPSPIVSLEPGGGRRHGGRTASGAAHRSTPSRRRAISTAITCCMPRAPICCGASETRPKRLRAMSGRWRWSPMTASGGFSRGGCAKFSRSKHAPLPSSSSCSRHTPCAVQLFV